MAADPKITDDIASFALVERGAAPEIFIDGYQGVTVINGVTKFNCYSVSLGADGAEERRVVLRLSCAVPTVVGLHAALTEIIAEMKRAGLIRETLDGKR